MLETLEIAKQKILLPAQLEERQLDQAFAHLYSAQIDAADLYFQVRRQESWVLEQGIIREGAHSIDQGVGVRAISGEKSGFAYTDDIQKSALLQACDAAKAIAKQGQEGRVQALQARTTPSLYLSTDPILSMSAEDKIALLHKIDIHARNQDARVQQVIASINGVHDIILVATSDGTLAADVRPLVRLNVSVIVEDKGKRETGSTGGGGRYDYQYFAQAGRIQHYAEEAVRQALLNLDAVQAPAGSMTVVLGSGWPGVLLHEAIGHGLEGDFNRKGTSAFSGRIGQLVASPLCTVVDDGTLANRRGSLNIDDEGVETQCTTLIDKGVLAGYMQDQLNAKLMGVSSTGNGRRESYAHLPLPRMTNTYMLAGESAPEEIIASVDNGIYAVNFSGGQVDITSGKFVFSANEAYLIEKGKITQPIKGATLIGNGPEVLGRVSMVGNDLALDRGVGTCGKEGQSVPVGVGQPTLRIDRMTVGGTQSS